MNKQSILVGLIFLFIIAPLWAEKNEKDEKNVFGRTYPILEEDFLQFIQRRLLEMQKNGEWQMHQKEWMKQVHEKTERPTAVKNIAKTTVKKSWAFDPSVIAGDDLRDHEGHIFAQKGSRFNPLSLVSLRATLLFYDGDDKNQVKWAKKQILLWDHNVKLILVNGNVKTQSALFQQKIYFDQEGRLIRHFHIEHVPALVFQEGIRLQITEDLA